MSDVNFASVSNAVLVAATVNPPVDAAPDVPAAVALAAGAAGDDFSAGFSATEPVDGRADAGLGDDDVDEGDGDVLVPETLVPARAPPVRAEASSALSRSMS